MASTIFERYGGFSAVRKIVSAFYDKVLDSPQLQKYFDGVEMKTLIDHQAKFISSVMGGPASYSDDALRRVHANLNISHSDFVEAADLLTETLEDFDFEPEDVSYVRRQVLDREPYIVTRQS